MSLGLLTRKYLQHAWQCGLLFYPYFVTLSLILLHEVIAPAQYDVDLAYQIIIFSNYLFSSLIFLSTKTHSKQFHYYLLVAKLKHRDLILARWSFYYLALLSSNLGNLCLFSSYFDLSKQFAVSFLSTFLLCALIAAILLLLEQITTNCSTNNSLILLLFLPLLLPSLLLKALYFTQQLLAGAFFMLLLAFMLIIIPIALTLSWLISKNS